MADKNPKPLIVGVDITEEEALGIAPNEPPAESFPVTKPPEGEHEPPAKTGLTPKDEKAILKANKLAYEGDLFKTDDIKEEPEHNDDPDKLYAPRQEGESEPPDLDELIRQEQREWDEKIKDSAIGS